jgi:hypothetical protein
MADKRTGICFRALADLGGLYAEQSLPPRRKAAQHRRNCCRLGERPEMGDLEPPEEEDAPSALQAEFFVLVSQLQQSLAGLLRPSCGCAGPSHHDEPGRVFTETSMMFLRVSVDLGKREAVTHINKCDCSGICGYTHT